MRRESKTTPAAFRNYLLPANIGKLPALELFHRDQASEYLTKDMIQLLGCERAFLTR
jgi:hypothetical protein